MYTGLIGGGGMPWRPAARPLSKGGGHAPAERLRPAVTPAFCVADGHSNGRVGRKRRLAGLPKPTIQPANRCK